MAGKGTEAGKAYVTLGLNAESLERGLKKQATKSTHGKTVASGEASHGGGGGFDSAPRATSFGRGDKLKK